MELDPVAAAEKILENDSIKDSDILDVLEHYGIEGQKWGVRNGPPYPLERKRMSASEKRAYKQEQKGKPTAYLTKRDKANIILEKSDDMSLQELQQALNRIELEEKLKNIRNTDDTSQGFVKKTLKESGGKILGTVVTGAGLYLTARILDNFFGAEVRTAIVGRR